MSKDKPVIFDDKSYGHLLDSIKTRIHSSQHQVAMYVNSELLYTYWNIGHALNQERDRQGWGAKVVDQLALDLKSSFPTMKGLSKRNLQYMMRFAAEWPTSQIVQPDAAQLEIETKKGANDDKKASLKPKVPPSTKQIQSPDNQLDIIVQPVVAQFQAFESQAFARVPWSHHMLLLDKIETIEERSFYCEQIISNNWSKRVLINKVDQDLYHSQGKLSNNFAQVLPTNQASMVTETFKDPYFFDFLQLGAESSEREIEDSLTTQIGKFLLELGAGFAYMGRQYKLEIGGKEYFLDLLFFHTKLNCYVNIELKIDAFKPEYAGKSQFYLTAIDEELKGEHHQPSVGIVLCKEANNIVVEYTLKQSSVPLGVAEYKLVHELPEQLRGLLPSAEEINNSIKRTQ